MSFAAVIGNTVMGLHERSPLKGFFLDYSNSNFPQK